MFSVTNKTRNESPISGSFFNKIKEEMLGKNYSLSLVFIGDNFSRNLNFRYRGKDKPTNVLSFPIDKEIGEIFLNIGQAKKEAEKYKLNKKKYIVFLFIHSLLHLKNYKHGPLMSKKEKYWLKRFKVAQIENIL